MSRQILTQDGSKQHEGEKGVGWQKLSDGARYG